MIFDYYLTDITQYELTQKEDKNKRGCKLIKHQIKSLKALEYDLIARKVL